MDDNTSASSRQARMDVPIPRQNTDLAHMIARPERSRIPLVSRLVGCNVKILKRRFSCMPIRIQQSHLISNTKEELF